jgi:hypothetical protein
MTKKTAQQRKKEAKQSREAVTAQLSALAHRQDDGDNDDVRVVTQEAALGEVGARFDARVAQQFGDGAAKTVADEDLPDVTDGVVGGAYNADEAPDLDEDGKPSRAQLKKVLRMSVDELKLRAPNPAVVEFHDANAPEPLFLVQLKNQRHSIPAPRHWLQKSLFLSNQVDRDPSDDIVPSFIESTGVAAMRPDQAKADPGALARPYLAGHPKLPVTAFGDIFYEGKDMRARFRRFKPGVLSERLRQALGMTMNAPPPWLYGMQRVARLPPSYPTLKVPGLNAPLPVGGRWGQSKGEWGQPPRAPDNSLIFPGVLREAADEDALGADVGHKLREKGYWGCLPESESRVQINVGKRNRTEAPAPVTAAPVHQPFVPAPHMLPQFPQMAPTQHVFASELQRVQAGYGGPGYMPTSQVFVSQQQQGAPGAAQGQYGVPQPGYMQPGFAPYSPPPPGVYPAPPTQQQQQRQQDPNRLNRL